MSSITSFRRSDYKSDTFNFVGSTNSFNGQVEDEINSNPSLVTKIVDGSVKITTVADNIRNSAIKHWKSRETAAKCSFCIPAVVLTGAVIATVVGGAIVVAAASETLLLVGGGLVAAAVCACAFGLIFSGISAACQSHAKRHKDTWKDPVEQVAYHRQQGGRRGYPYLSENNDLRQKSFAPGERTSLALRTCTDYLQRHGNIRFENRLSQVQFVDEFFSSNPLARSNHSDAFGSNMELAGNLRAASEVYHSHETVYHSVVREADARRRGVAQARDETLNQLHIRKELLNTRLRMRFSQALRRWNLEDRNVSHNWYGRNLLASLNGRYAMMQNRIDVEFSLARQNVIQIADEQTALVNEWEISRKALYVEPIGQILEAFVHGSELDAESCGIEHSAETLPPEGTITYVFPSFDLSDMQDEDPDNLMDLGNGSECVV